jgi:5-methylcytosine-specific restriction endonuclease McrA
VDPSEWIRLRQKQPKFKLNSEGYSMVRKQVLQRDGWHCQDCGAARDLQVHHMKPRSQLAGDITQNLITLCATCHGKRHGRR